MTGRTHEAAAAIDPSTLLISADSPSITQAYFTVVHEIHHGPKDNITIMIDFGPLGSRQRDLPHTHQEQPDTKIFNATGFCVSHLVVNELRNH